VAERSDNDFMSRALDLAIKARGWTSPNPMVGAVIVKNGRIIAEGFHRRAGSEHAEAAALRKAGRRADGATVYVTLEPCCHVGYTGPCTDAISQAGIRRVVYASVDPNPIVRGKGDRRLRSAGIKITRGVLKREAEEINEAYYLFHREGRPFVTLKMAQTLDGRIATITGDSQWISSPASRKLAHRLRAENDAVMVGAGTVRADNPALTVRLVKGRNPYRIIVAGRGELPSDSQVFVNNQDLKTVVAGARRFAARRALGGVMPGPVRWTVKTDKRGRVDLSDLIQKAAAFGIQSILVEGGSGLATSLLANHLVDKMVLVIAPKIIGHGTSAIGDLGITKLADGIVLDRVTVQQMGPDQVVTGYPKYKV
jgi:diaminohydroxyphosphoribosylaminopyrimidine deaminase / 5-amino-6-(5-phosphoribosylamino)uracil reductase